MKIISHAVKLKDPRGDCYVEMRLYVEAAPTGGGTPSRVFELSMEEAKNLGNDLSYAECALK